MEKLRACECAQMHDPQAAIVAALIEAQLAAGQVARARIWWQWAARLLARPLSGDARITLLSSVVRTAPWLCQADLSGQLQTSLPHAVGRTVRMNAEAALTEHLLSRGDLAAAETTARAWWPTLATREALVWGANLYVRVLRAGGHTAEAQAAGETALHLSVGLDTGHQLWARLAWLCAFLDSVPATVAAGLTDLAARSPLPEGSPFHVQVMVYQALARQAGGHARQAGALLRPLQVNPALLLLLGLRAQERRGWLPEGGASRPPPRAEIELNFLGSPEIRVRGSRVRMRARFAELLVALALRPTGLSGEELTLHVYGEAGNPNCCKTELSRLRHLVGIETRPYRLTAPVQADFLEFPRRLAGGLTPDALRLYRGPLLRASDAPVVREQREWLHELLRQTLLTCPDPDLAWQAADHFPDDLQVWEALAERLPDRDPRHPAAVARREVLHRGAGM